MLTLVSNTTYTFMIKLNTQDKCMPLIWAYVYKLNKTVPHNILMLLSFYILTP